MQTWVWVVGSVVGALCGAFAFLIWACVFVGRNAEPLDDWERRLRGD